MTGTPGYNTPIPGAILTPDRVPTRIGTLEFRDGFPTPETSRLVYDHVDFLRGVQVFLDFLPAASLEAMRLGMVSLGATAAHQVVILDRLLDSNPLFLTGNTDTVYVSGFLDLERDGPTVVEIPPGSGPGTVNDAFFRFVIDMGGPGPDRGQGGRYLILPDNFAGEVPEGYFVARSPSRVNWLILRGFLRDGRPDAAVASFTEAFGYTRSRPPGTRRRWSSSAGRSGCSTRSTRTTPRSSRRSRMSSPASPSG